MDPTPKKKATTRRSNFRLLLERNRGSLGVINATRVHVDVTRVLVETTRVFVDSIQVLIDTTRVLRMRSGS